MRRGFLLLLHFVASFWEGWERMSDVLLVLGESDKVFKASDGDNRVK